MGNGRKRRHGKNTRWKQIGRDTVKNRVPEHQEKKETRGHIKEGSTKESNRRRLSP
jgi:hypothetical protein